jgi:hypothetical protein
MPHLIALLTLIMLFAGPALPRASEESAAALLLDNEDLCLRIGRAGPTEMAPPARAAARALAAESLTIASELVDELPTSERTRCLTDVLELQRRVCGEESESDPDSELEHALRSASRKLETTIRLEEQRKSEILTRFLDRRERATYRALERPHSESAQRKPTAVMTTGSAAEISEARRARVEEAWLAGREEAASEEAAGEEAASETARAAMTVSDGGSAAGPAGKEEDGSGITLEGTPAQSWDPSPEVMAHRRKQKMNAFRRRFEVWRPAFRREMLELSVLRSKLARELESRSLQHVQSLCGQLTGAVNRIEYEVVLSAPEPSVREFLDRMLASYAAAGRWCTSGRFSFAWIEIEKADQRWRQLSERLVLLDAG